MAFGIRGCDGRAFMVVMFVVFLTFMVVSFVIGTRGCSIYGIRDMHGCSIGEIHDCCIRDICDCPFTASVTFATAYDICTHRCCGIRDIRGCVICGLRSLMWNFWYSWRCYVWDMTDRL